jgi:hypothetical protein
MDNPIPPANKAALIENLLRVIAASFGDLPHSLNLFQSVIWEGRTASSQAAPRYWQKFLPVS